MSVSSTGDSMAAGGSCPIHPARRGTARSARIGWESVSAVVPEQGGGPDAEPADAYAAESYAADPYPVDPYGPPGIEAASHLIGYRGPTACAAAGITYRQLDYWARTGLVEPSVRAAQGSGTQRLYGFRDILLLKVVKRLLDAGVSLQSIRASVVHLRACGVADLSGITLMSDGATVYQCTSPHQVVDLLQGGQGVFGIALGAVWRELESSLRRLHGERADTGETVVGYDPGDELARRRNRAG